MTPNTAFCLFVFVFAVAVFVTAVQWSRWDMRRAIRKEIKKFVDQEAAIKRITGEL